MVGPKRFIEGLVQIDFISMSNCQTGLVALSTTKIAKTNKYQIGRSDMVLLSQQHKHRSFLRLRSGKTYENIQIVGIITNQLGIIHNQSGLILSARLRDLNMSYSNSTVRHIEITQTSIAQTEQQDRSNKNKMQLQNLLLLQDLSSSHLE